MLQTYCHKMFIHVVIKNFLEHMYYVSFNLALFLFFRQLQNMWIMLKLKWNHVKKRSVNCCMLDRWEMPVLPNFCHPCLTRHWTQRVPLCLLLPFKVWEEWRSVVLKTRWLQYSIHFVHLDKNNFDRKQSVHNQFWLIHQIKIF